MTLISILWINPYLKRKQYYTDKRILLTDIICKSSQKVSEAQGECAFDYQLHILFPKYPFIAISEIDSIDNEHEKDENEPIKEQRKTKLSLKKRKRQQQSITIKIFTVTISTFGWNQ